VGIEVQVMGTSASSVMSPWTPGWVTFAKLNPHRTTFVYAIVLKKSVATNPNIEDVETTHLFKDSTSWRLGVIKFDEREGCVRACCCNELRILRLGSKVILETQTPTGSYNFDAF